MIEEEKNNTIPSLEYLKKVLPGNTISLKITFFIFLFFSIYLLYLTLTPFVNVIILAVIVSGMLYPVYLYVRRYIRSSSLASIIVLVALIVCVVLPLVVIVALMIPEIIRSVDVLQQELSKRDISTILSNENIESIRIFMRDYFPWLEFDTTQLQEDLLAFSRSAGQFLLKSITSILKNLVYFAAQFCLFILILFFLLRDGYGMLQRLQELLPLSFTNFERITNSLRRVAKAVFIGGFLVALMQGIVAGVVFSIVGYSALLGGFATALASLIPVVGTGLVWLPFSCYLFFVEGLQTSLIFFLLNVIIVTNIDTFMRPYFMSGNVGSSVLFIFLSILGGIQVFGILGILYGPLILALALVMVDIYSDEYLRNSEKEINKA